MHVQMSCNIIVTNVSLSIGKEYCLISVHGLLGLICTVDFGISDNSIWDCVINASSA